MRHLIVDGMNVIGSRPSGWWRDRDAAVLELAGRLGRLHERTGQPITVVLDGRPPAGLPEGDHLGVRVLFALRPGPDAADDRIVDLVASSPAGWEVVTADRGLRARLAEHGVTLSGPGRLLQRLDELDAS